MTPAQVADRPIAALTGADHVQGQSHARLTLLEYGDYACPACMRAETPLRQLLERDGGRVRFVFRHFPLMALHPQAELAAEAAEAAAAQGQFWPMHRLLFGRQGHLDAGALADAAESIGLDMIRFRGEMADRIYTQRVQEHRRAGEHSGVRTTPAFFLEGIAFDVSFGFAHLVAAIQAATMHPSNGRSPSIVAGRGARLHDPRTQGGPQ